MINYNDYPDNWLTEIRPKILERANNKCEFCGCDNNKWIWYHPSADLPEMSHIWTQDENQAMTWHGSYEGNTHGSPEHGHLVVLTIAHIHDPNPMNCADDNLKALCQRCHLRHDAKMKANNRKSHKLHEQENLGQLKLKGF